MYTLLRFPKTTAIFISVFIFIREPFDLSNLADSRKQRFKFWYLMVNLLSQVFLAVLNSSKSYYSLRNPDCCPLPALKYWLWWSLMVVHFYTKICVTLK
jgi:hypothetical protein